MTLWYLATPYSKFPAGLDAAWRLACRETGRLILAGVRVYSPIAHTHPIAMECGINPLDHSVWLPADEPMMESATGLIMLRADSWKESYGMDEELKAFRCARKPVVWMDPGLVPEEFL